MPNPLIMKPVTTVEALRSAVHGYMMEHGFYPDFVLMSQDVAHSLFAEVDANRAKYGGLVKINGDAQPMTLAIGAGIEIGQRVGSNRVELVSDAAIIKAKRSMGMK